MIKEFQAQPVPGNGHERLLRRTVGNVIDALWKDSRFDGLSNGVLQEAKGLGYANFITNGEFQGLFTGSRDLANQARPQVEAAGGTPIAGSVADPEAVSAIRKLLADVGVDKINVVHVPVRQEWGEVAPVWWTSSWRDSVLAGRTLRSGQRRKFTPEYRRRAAMLVIDTGCPVSHVAKELGVGEALLGRRVGLESERLGKQRDTPLTDGERAESARLRKEVVELRVDRDFLSKAAFFATEQRQK